MADTTGKTPSHLNEWYRALQEKPHEFDFFQALRLIECIYPHKQRFGRGSLPTQEPPVRLGQRPEMTFAPASLDAFEPENDEHPARLLVRFLGLLGPNGPLPLHLTEHTQNRQRHHKDPTFNRFLDIFHHRLLSLFYRAWAEAQPTIHFDRPETDRFSSYVGALFGLGMPTLRNRDAIDDASKLYFGGRLASQTKNAEGLKALITEYFQVEVQIQECIGEWVKLPRRHRYRLGTRTGLGKLGKSVIVGDKVYLSQHKFRIRLGPLDYDTYLEFLPHQEKILKLVTLVRNYIGDELSFDIQLHLGFEHVPGACLDGKHHLGWTTWLDPQMKSDQADEFIFDAGAALRIYHPQPSGKAS